MRASSSSSVSSATGAASVGVDAIRPAIASGTTFDVARIRDLIDATEAAVVVAPGTRPWTASATWAFEAAGCSARTLWIAAATVITGGS